MKDLNTVNTELDSMQFISEMWATIVMSLSSSKNEPRDLTTPKQLI